MRRTPGESKSGILSGPDHVPTRSIALAWAVPPHPLQQALGKGPRRKLLFTPSEKETSPCEKSFALPRTALLK